MMYLLLRQEVFVQTATPTLSSAERAPSDIWMGIYTTSNQGPEGRVGYVHMTSLPGVENGQTGTRYGLAFNLSTRMLSIPTELDLTGNAWVADGIGLSHFEFKVHSFGEHLMQASGNIKDGQLNLNIQTAGESFPASFPVGNDLLVQGSLGATALNLPVLEIGDSVLIDAFDPLTMTKGKARIECIGMETLIYQGEEVVTKILTSSLAGVTTKLWIDLDEQIMQVETPVGLTLRRITQAEALEDIDDSQMDELIDHVAIRPTGKTPFRGAARMRIRVEGLPPEIDLPTGSIQYSPSPGEYVIDIPSPPDGTEPVDIPSFFEPFLKGDPFVQTGHTRILNRTQEILGDTLDPWEQAQLLYEWVYQEIDKTPVLSFPSALEVLESRKGDCNEHTVLYTALARTANIPTRMALGVVWSDQLNGFYYHAWPEVFVGYWIPVDPTLGQPIADATHIKLLEGNIEQWPKLSPFLGQLKIEVMEVE